MGNTGSKVVTIGLKANLVSFSAMDRLRNLLQRACRWAAYRLMSLQRENTYL